MNFNKNERERIEKIIKREEEKEGKEMKMDDEERERIIRMEDGDGSEEMKIEEEVWRDVRKGEVLDDEKLKDVVKRSEKVYEKRKDGN